MESWRLFAQIDHHKPIANGYSSNFPPGYAGFQLDMAYNFPRLGLLCTLNRRLGVNTLVVDRYWLAHHGSRISSFSTYLHLLYTDDDVRIYRLRMRRDQCITAT